MAALSDSSIAAYARAAGFTGHSLVVAVAVALAESGGDPNATNHNTNGSTDYGLWQINSIHSQLLAQHLWSQPADNAAMAYSISSHGTNWYPWTTYKTGSYLRFVGRANTAARGAASAALPPTGPAPSTGNGSGSSAGGIMRNAAATSPSGFSLFDASTWLRVAMFIAGGLALIAALYNIGLTETIGGTIKSAVKAAR